MKKVLSLVLVIAMVLSSMSFAFAGTFTDIADTDYAEAIEMLTALEIIDGYEDGTFKPEKTITRAEMAKLMVITLGYGDLVAGSKSNFADTQGHWADSYIALAAGKGIVLGTGEGKFTPDRAVSYDEAITMLVRGLGYTDNCNELKGMTWPTNFKVKAAELDITDNVAMVATGADRGGVAQLIANALEATLVSVNSDGDVILLYNTYGTDKEERQLLTRVAEYNNDFEVTTDKVDPKNKNFAGEVVDLAPYMFQNLKVYLNDDDQVVYVKGANSLVVEGIVDGVDGKTLTVENLAGKLVDIDFDSVKVDKSLVFENGSVKKSNIELADLEDAETITVVATDSEKENGKIEGDEVDGFVITTRTRVVRIEKEYVAGKAKIDSIVLPEDNDEVDLENIYVTGAAEALEDIEEDDIVVVYASEDDTVLTLVVTRETIEGKVTREVDSDTFHIDGKAYDFATKSIVKALELGDEGIFFLDQEGDIADYDGESVGPQDYAVVLAVANGTTDKDRFDDSLSVDDYPSLKLATQKDEELIIDIEVDVTKAGEAEDSAEDENGNALVTGALVVDKTVVNENYLIKYKLNKDGRISEIDVVTKLTSNSYKTVDLGKTSNTLVSDAIIFDAGDDYAVVNENKLPTKVEAFIVRNSSGEITVLVAEKDEVEKAAEEVFVYVSAVAYGYNNDGDEVQILTIYTDGAKVTDVETTEDDTIRDFKQGIYAVEYDGEAIDKATRKSTEVVTAETVNAKGNMIEVANEWFVMSENGTVVAADVDAKGKYEVDSLADLYDIDEDETEIEIYENEDGDIDLIVIILSDKREEAPVVDKAALNAAVATADAKKEADYTAASWTEFETALTAAKAMPEATQAEVNAKLVAVNAAVAKLDVKSAENTTVEFGVGALNMITVDVSTEAEDAVNFEVFKGAERKCNPTALGTKTALFAVVAGDQLTVNVLDAVGTVIDTVTVIAK